MKVKGQSCCSHLNGLEVVFLCDNCGAMVVEKDAGKHTVQCIDSVRAKKALECVESIAQEIATHYHPGVKDILKAYGFMK